MPWHEKKDWENKVKNANGLASKIGAATGTISVVAIVALINLAWENGQEIGYVSAIVSRNASDIQSTRTDMQAWLADQKRDMESWTKQVLKSERQRWVEGGPVYTSEILAIQRAIAEIPTDDLNSWTIDGKPRVMAIQHRMGGRQISSEARDMAWTLLKMSRTLRR